MTKRRAEEEETEDQASNSTPTHEELGDEIGESRREFWMCVNEYAWLSMKMARSMAINLTTRELQFYTTILREELQVIEEDTIQERRRLRDLQGLNESERS